MSLAWILRIGVAAALIKDFIKDLIKDLIKDISEAKQEFIKYENK